MVHLARERCYMLAQTCLIIPIFLTTACQGVETEPEADTGTTKSAVGVQLTGSLIEQGGFNYPWQINDNNESSGAWGAGDLAFVGYDLGSLKQVQEVRSYGDQAYGFAVQLFDANWTQTGWYECNIDGSAIKWQGCDIPDTNARFVYVRYRTKTTGSWVQELDIYGGDVGSGGVPGTGGIPTPPSGWVLDLNDDFDRFDWNKWKQGQKNVPLIHTVMYMNTQSNCVFSNGYLEMRATKRNDGSGIWDGCYLDQGTWWDSNANKPAHPGYADYQVSFKANLPPGMGTGMYFLMWPVAESWGGTPWPPELDIVELPFNDGDDIMTTWHWDPDNKQSEIRPAVDRRNGKQWVYTARRVGNNIRMWIGDPSTNTIREIPLPAAFSNNPDYKRMLVGMANFVASTWAINGSASAFWYGDANATGATSWTAYLDYVKVWKPGPGMSGQ